MNNKTKILKNLASNNEQKINNILETYRKVGFNNDNLNKLKNVILSRKTTKKVKNTDGTIKLVKINYKKAAIVDKRITTRIDALTKLPSKALFYKILSLTKKEEAFKFVLASKKSDFYGEVDAIKVAKALLKTDFKNSLSRLAKEEEKIKTEIEKYKQRLNEIKIRQKSLKAALTDLADQTLTKILITKALIESLDGDFYEENVDNLRELAEERLRKIEEENYTKKEAAEWYKQQVAILFEKLENGRTSKGSYFNKFLNAFANNIKSKTISGASTEVIKIIQNRYKQGLKK